MPIGRDNWRETVLPQAQEIQRELVAAGIRVTLDERDERPGWKFSEWEMRGVPLRLEIGPKDIEKSPVLIARRDTREKQACRWTGSPRACATCWTRSSRTCSSARCSSATSTRSASTTYDAFKQVMEGRPGFVIAPWCGSADCEAQIKTDTQATIRNMPLGGSRAVRARASAATARRRPRRGSRRRTRSAGRIESRAVQVESACGYASACCASRLRPQFASSALATASRSSSSRVPPRETLARDDRRNASARWSRHQPHRALARVRGGDRLEARRVADRRQRGQELDRQRRRAPLRAIPAGRRARYGCRGSPARHGPRRAPSPTPRAPSPAPRASRSRDALDHARAGAAAGREPPAARDGLARARPDRRAAARRPPRQHVDGVDRACRRRRVRRCRRRARTCGSDPARAPPERRDRRRSSVESAGSRRAARRPAGERIEGDRGQPVDDVGAARPRRNTRATRDRRRARRRRRVVDRVQRTRRARAGRRSPRAPAARPPRAAAARADSTSATSRRPRARRCTVSRAIAASRVDRAVGREVGDQRVDLFRPTEALMATGRSYKRNGRNPRMS